jgi:hypothetical protein
MTSMDDLGRAPSTTAERDERINVIENAVTMRGEQRNKYLASAKQVVFLIDRGMPWRDALEATKAEAQIFLARWQRDTGTLNRRYEAMRSRSPLDRCACPHCLGHAREDSNDGK